MTRSICKKLRLMKREEVTIIKSFPLLISDQQRSGREEDRSFVPSRGRRRERETGETCQSSLQETICQLVRWGAGAGERDHVSAEGERWSGDDWSQHNASCVSEIWLCWPLWFDIGVAVGLTMDPLPLYTEYVILQQWPAREAERQTSWRTEFAQSFLPSSRKSRQVRTNLKNQLNANIDLKLCKFLCLIETPNNMLIISNLFSVLTRRQLPWGER